MKKTTSGFTIVELLVVIVIIGILAAITVTTYNGVQNRSYYSAVQSDLVKLSKRMAIYKTSSSDGKYPVALAGSLRDGLSPVEIRINTKAYSTVANSNFTYYESDDGSDYAILATVKNGPVLSMKGSDPTVRTYTNATQYPAGSAQLHVQALGLNELNYDNYAVYVGNGGGWRIWN